MAKRPTYTIRDDVPVPLAAKERNKAHVKAYQDKKVADGARMLRVWIDREDVERLETLKAKHGNSTEVVKAGLKALAGDEGS